MSPVNSCRTSPSCFRLSGAGAVTVIATDRLAETTISKNGEGIDTWYIGKVHDFGGNRQALMDPRGVPRRVSDVLLGHVHELTAASGLVLAIAWPYAKIMPIVANCGYGGASYGALTSV